MLYDKHEVEIGGTAWLDAHTKTCPSICYLAPQVTVEDMGDWPIVVVSLPSGDRIRVHKDDIKKRPPARTKTDKRQGDGAGIVQPTRTLRKEAKYDVAIPDGMEQSRLF